MVHQKSLPDPRKPHDYGPALIITCRASIFYREQYLLIMFGSHAI